jgi:hypothetical protein
MYSKYEFLDNKAFYAERGKTGIFLLRNRAVWSFKSVFARDWPVRIRNKGIKNRIQSMGGV